MPADRITGGARINSRSLLFRVVGGAVVVAFLAVGANLLLAQPGELSPAQSCGAGTECSVQVEIKPSGLFGCRIVVPAEILLPRDLKSIIWDVSPAGYRFSSKTSGVEILGSHAGDFTAASLTSARQFKFNRNPPTTPEYEYELHIVGDNLFGLPRCEGPAPNRPRIKNE